MLGNVYDVLLVLHVHCDELVANFRSMLSVVDKAELLILDVHLHLWIIVQPDAFTFDFLAPAIFVQTFSEENHIRQNGSVIVVVNPVAHSV